MISELGSRHSSMLRFAPRSSWRRSLATSRSNALPLDLLLRGIYITFSLPAPAVMRSAFGAGLPMGGHEASSPRILSVSHFENSQEFTTIRMTKAIENNSNEFIIQEAIQKRKNANIEDMLHFNRPMFLSFILHTPNHNPCTHTEPFRLHGVPAILCCIWGISFFHQLTCLSEPNIRQWIINPDSAENLPCDKAPPTKVFSI